MFCRDLLSQQLGNDLVVGIIVYDLQSDIVTSFGHISKY